MKKHERRLANPDTWCESCDRELDDADPENDIYFVGCCDLFLCRECYEEHHCGEK